MSESISPRSFLWSQSSVSNELEAGKLPDRRSLTFQVQSLGQYSPDWPNWQLREHRGTLNLTSSGGKYAGSFEFTAGFNRDGSKTVKITGSFADLLFQ